MSNVINPKPYFKAKDKNSEVREMLDALKSGVSDVFTSGKYEHYLTIMSQFHNYSLNNSLLIAMQMPTATRCAGYTDWKRKFHRQVRKGEKGLRILRPQTVKFTKVNENGEEEEFTKVKFYPTSTFDISQTDGDPLPSLVKSIKGDVPGYDALVEKLRKVSPVDIGFEEISGGANGYYSLAEKRIAIKANMSEAHTVKTMVHEISHAILHDRDDGKEKDADRKTMEVQAESVAYIVNKYLGIDTSDYSFGYIAGWSSGKETKELKNSLKTIKETATRIIEEVEL